MSTTPVTVRSLPSGEVEIREGDKVTVRPLSSGERAWMTQYFARERRKGRRELHRTLAKAGILPKRRRSVREGILAEALGSMIALLEVMLRGCGHSGTLLCDNCTRNGRRALVAARRAMIHGVATASSQPKR
jgi:hypothetical protein